MSKSGQQPSKADVGGQRSKTEKSKTGNSGVKQGKPAPSSVTPKKGFIMMALTIYVWKRLKRPSSTPRSPMR